MNKMLHFYQTKISSRLVTQNEAPSERWSHHTLSLRYILIEQKCDEGRPCFFTFIGSQGVHWYVFKIPDLWSFFSKDIQGHGVSCTHYAELFLNKTCTLFTSRGRAIYICALQKWAYIYYTARSRFLNDSKSLLRLNGLIFSWDSKCRSNLYVWKSLTILCPQFASIIPWTQTFCFGVVIKPLFLHLIS